MNKRIICLLLSVIMILSVVLTGCSSKTSEEAMEKINEEASEATMTLTMYLMSEEEVSDEQASKIEDAVNKITKSKFKTKLVLKYFTEEEYTTALETAFQKTNDEIEARKAAEKALKEAIKRGEATSTTEPEGTTAEETIINELGVTELKYPSVSENQVDIFYLGGYDKFMEYYDKGWLTAIDDTLTTESKTLNTYIFNDYFSNIKFATGDTCIVPNNVLIGEYTYLLLNKDVLAKYNYSVDNAFPNLVCSNVQDILDKVARYDRDTYVPLYSGTGELDVANVGYIGLDENGLLTNEFSLMGGSFSESAEFRDTNCYFGFSNIFADSNFKSQLMTLASYKENGYYAKEGEESKPFAVGYVKGNYEDAFLYAEDYEVVVVEKPRMTTADAYDNTFAVSSYTRSASRSMKILTYLNTNETFRNLILYGIEGENYEIVEKEVDGVVYKTVKRLKDNEYMMALEKTGNTMIAYPLESELPNLREYQKIQNSEAYTALDFSFRINYNNAEVNMEAMKRCRELADQLYEELLACDTVEKMDIFLNGFKDTENPDNSIVSARKRVDNDKLASLMLNYSYSKDSSSYASNAADPEIGEGVALAYVYFNWLDENKIYVPMT